MKAQAFSLQHPILPVPRFSFNVTPPSLCCSNGENNDGFYIKRCVEIARKGVRYTSPMVGCVIVKDGNVVGQGFHPKAGQPHVEIPSLIFRLDDEFINSNITFKLHILTINFSEIQWFRCTH
ncbi:putative diaminohydroxyphosphoribosylaminopyrimidine deaminase [Lupinus albus]|uniref:Putative diaminohydroxyphosphoribosylaminopyrimidine deaminase n=1 Tax=Lupinus albus TaxID=3870 RepID=A0A6A4QMN2_LUPAL|nr:putative diaminohydroxyphosphoribosylaminopyrimidine deaminase [Lupinus albus]